jgi:hypothetical protein
MFTEQKYTFLIGEYKMLFIPLNVQSGHNLLTTLETQHTNSDVKKQSAVFERTTQTVSWKFTV